jgi:plastocyanin
MRKLCLLGLFLATAITVPAPTLTFSSYLGGEGSDKAFGITVDRAGNSYVVGDAFSTETTFPITNAFKPANPIFADGFLTKISPSGTIVFSTFFGGATNDGIRAVALDAASNIYLAGVTASDTGMPVSNAFQAAFGPPGTNGFVAKLGASGTTLVYASYFGGSGFDEILGLAVDTAGAAIVVGRTHSSDLPVTQAVYDALSGPQDGFVAKVHPAGTALVFCTYWGGSGSDAARDVAVDDGGNIYVVGETDSSDFPLQNPFRGTLSNIDGFLTKLLPSGTAAVFSTYFGGGSADYLSAVAVDRASNVCLGGYGQSTDLLLTNAIQPNFGGYTWDMYLARLLANGTQLQFCTFLGGGNTEYVYDLALDSAGYIHAVGSTESPDFPARGSPTGSPAGLYDGVLCKLSPDGRHLLYGVLHGGEANDSARGVALQPDGTVHAVGESVSTNLPLVNPFQTNILYSDAAPLRLQDEPVITAFSVLGSNVVQWAAYSGLSYKVQSSTDVLAQVWTDLALPALATGHAASFTSSAASCCPSYRVAQVPPLTCSQGFAGCGSYQDQTAPASNRIVVFDFAFYSPKCMRIKAGQMVTFVGAFGSHPFNWSCQEGGPVTNDPPGGATPSQAAYTFNTPGYYSYYCGVHGTSGGSGMSGSIEVVP